MANRLPVELGHLGYTNAMQVLREKCHYPIIMANSVLYCKNVTDSHIILPYKFLTGISVAPKKKKKKFCTRSIVWLAFSGTKASQTISTPMRAERKKFHDGKLTTPTTLRSSKLEIIYSV